MRRIRIKSTRIFKKCVICGDKFYKPSESSWLEWNSKKFCSKKCYWTTVASQREGKKLSKETIEKIKATKIAKYGTVGFKFGTVPWNKGIKSWVKPWLGKQRLSLRKEIKSIWREYRHQVAGRLEYTNWRMAVFQRDKFTCRICGVKGVYLEADHIKRVKEFPGLIFDINNGQTLCKKCHRIKCAEEQRNKLTKML